MHMTSKILTAAALLAFPCGLLAQDDAAGDVEFRLFEEVEQSSAQEQRVRRQNSDSNSNNTEPAFTLVGTSHIGDNYSAILQFRGGDPIKVSVNPDGNTRIPGHQGYNIVHIGPGTVSIRHPDDDPCLDAPLKGVRCNQAVNIAALELANGAPIAQQTAVEVQEPEQAPQETADAEAVEEPLNPFAQLRAAREANANNGTAPAPFTRRTIADEDIPPGMRRVSTPFGDRLVQQ